MSTAPPATWPPAPPSATPPCSAPSPEPSPPQPSANSNADVRLDEARCRERVGAARVGRLATVGGDLRPHVVPVTFAVGGDELFVGIDQKPKSTVDLKRLRNIAGNPRVAVLVDEYDDDWAQLWWVRVDGVARVLEDDRAAVELLVAKYPQYVADPPLGPVIAIRADGWSGWAYSGEES
ncbi:TIGR03668 family PPOX class F420-dependent oxidoreductase [Kribbella sp. NPDC055071]